MSALRIVGAKDRRLKFEALFWLTVFRLALAILPFARVMRLHKRAARSPKAAAPADGRIYERVERAIGRTGRFVPGARCLAQALAGQVLLGRRGAPSDLRIGVARGDGRRLVAHAWLEKDGRAILGGPAGDEYTPLGDHRDVSP